MTGELRSIDSIVRERAALPAVQELEQNSNCQAIDIRQAKQQLGEFANHFGYTNLNRVPPLLFAWKANSDLSQQLQQTTIPAARQPGRFSVPMVTMVDYINENVAGHPGVIHGGMTATLATSLMGLAAALNFSGQDVVVSTMKMDYRKPVFTASFVKVHAWLYGASKGTASAAVRLYDLQNQLLYEAVSDLKISGEGVGN
ncbi:hypothetical protein DL89DRAFT_295597 [Linderina pennispora]|uniref:Thioesterase domain-containing protein n=1 Tax=Linderina pennispora TaxID=61395 RepID=A0A1Y1VZS5_9FUNG|nr:uncharacterized protein DL89DRAFT_295597 [Linderina pennispora]ORX66354.1 hypothetical protein DL89DRAFT_295597 [Linderina pennispora]